METLPRCCNESLTIREDPLKSEMNRILANSMIHYFQEFRMV